MSASGINGEWEDIARRLETRLAAVDLGIGLGYVRVELEERRNYRWSSHYVCRTVGRDGRRGPRVLVKQLKARDGAGRTQGACRAADDPVVLEFRALQRIFEQVSSAGVAEIGAVRPLAHLPEQAAIAMEYRPGRDLRTLIGRAAVPWANVGAIAVATSAVHAAGRLLAEVHRLGCDGAAANQQMAPTWREQLDAVVPSAAESVVGLPVATRLGNAVTLVSRLADAGESVVPRVLLHGDLYPDNFMLTADGKVLVVDTLLNQRGFAEEDVAKFIAGVEGLKHRILGGGWVCRAAVVEKMVAAFLAGYREAGCLIEARLERFRFVAGLRRWSELIANLRARLPAGVVRRLIAGKAAGFLEGQIEQSLAGLRKVGQGPESSGTARLGTGRKLRVLDLINTDRSARELLDWRVAYVNAGGVYENAIYCGPGECAEQLRARGQRVFTIDQPRDLAPWPLWLAVWRTWRLLRREKFDIVHTHGSVIGLIGRVAAFFGGARLVVHQVHGWHHHAGMGAVKCWVFVQIERLLMLTTDKVLFQNTADIAECRRRKIAPERKVVLVGNGIQLSSFANDTVPVNRVARLLCVARFEPVKNHRQLIEAAALLRDRGVVFELLLVGDGVLRAPTEALVREHKLTEQVQFLGYRADVPALTIGADICVLTSLKEGLPRAIIEAAAAGRPMVATDVIGNRDVIVDGKTGFLVPLGDPAKLADRLQVLIAQPALRGRLGAEAREHAAQNFDERRVTERIIEVYNHLVAGTGG